MTQDKAFAILKTGANVFLTGEPGSGKSYTVNRYVRWLRDHNIDVAITASTGIAATHIGGATIHSWSGIGIKNRLSSHDISAIAGKGRVSQRMKNASVLIIDEVSMLSANTLTMVETVCRKIRGVNAPFGGLQVVLVGDFFQLPPIVRHELEKEEAQQLLIEEEKDRSIFAFGSAAWRALDPVVCYLTEQHRQEDAAFLNFLSALRRGQVAASHHELLQTRRQPARVGATQLFSHNADVDRLNDRELARLKEDRRTFTMTSSGPSDMVNQLRNGCLSPEILTLKIGAKVMFTKNDQSFKFVNGTLGTVVGFSKENQYPIIKTMSGRTVTATPLEWSINDGDAVLARLIQVPLRLAWAITVHKSQGMSLDAAHMDLSQVFEYGQGYVALSRVRTLEGLTLAGINQRALEVHPEIMVKDELFREASEKADASFGEMAAGDLLEQQNDFIRRAGGKTSIKESLLTMIKKARAPKPQVEGEKAYSVEAIRAEHTNAYRPWSKEEDQNVLHRKQSGESVANIAKALGRKPGAIRSRLEKLLE